MKFKTSLSQVVFTAILLSTAIACGSQVQDSSLKITNGIKKQPDRFKAVIYQDGCTGTFVSPTTIITAAHCADKGFTFKGVRTISFRSMPEALKKSWGFNIDVRLLVFPKAVAPAWIPISTKRVEGDEAIVFAGFGTYDLKNNKNDGQFRYGTSNLLGFESGENLLITHGTDLEAIAGTEGTNSGVGPGDSGGPLLRDGLLIGVASGIAGLGDDRHKSFHVNLTEPSIKAFLDEAVKGGIDIRFDGEGSIPYEECFDVNADKESEDFKFEVPHRQLVSVSGSWKICKDCQLIDGRGYTEGDLKDLKPIFKDINAGALLVELDNGFARSKADFNPKAWTGETLSFQNIGSGAKLAIHDSLIWTDNKGILKACFR
ncbi:MAG: trypsin-like serine protease [Proteobacteria bacterium]|nr:MAG: trypsin-like serine protease [Pseudomonadota bacterium]